MLATRKLPSVQAILPNVEEYIDKVQYFYQQKVQFMMYKISQFIQLANQLTEIPEHLAIELNYIKRMPHITYEQKQIEKLMILNQIEKFINLKNEVIQSSVGTKYHYPQLPKIQRKIRRKISDSQINISSSDSQKNDSATITSSSSNQNQSINQITNLLGTLNLQNKTNQQIFDSIQNIVAQMSQITLSQSKSIEEENKIKQNSNNININNNQTQLFSKSKSQCQQQTSQIDHTLNQLQQLRYQKKIQIFNFSDNQDKKYQNNTSSNKFNKILKQKLLLLKQNFKIHLQKQVQDIMKKIKQILIKAVVDFKKHDRAYVPIHKISSYFAKLNTNFYRSEGVIKSLHKYLTKKIKQCIVDSEEIYLYHGSQIKIKTNFRLRFFKHILIENIFFIWLKNAVIDMGKILKDNQNQDKKVNLNNKIQIQNCQQKQQQQTNIKQLSMDIFPNRKDSHSFEHFIM